MPGTHLVRAILLVVLLLNGGAEEHGRIEDEVGRVFGEVENNEVEIQANNAAYDWKHAYRQWGTKLCGLFKDTVSMMRLPNSQYSRNPRLI
jgi:hypothetical protein